MKKVLLVYVPFCTPASPPYSITQLHSFLNANCDMDINVLDLNVEFHILKFPKFQQYYSQNEWNDYNKITTDYRQITSLVYSENNKLIVNGKKPELFHELVTKIKNMKPDIVAFSIVYSSQAFYAYALLKELKKLNNVVTIIGGPAINEKLMSVADKTLQNEIEFLNYLNEKEIDHDMINFNTIPDFSIYNLKKYFTPFPVIPIRTSTTCYYKKCTFCSHFSNVPYYEFSLDVIRKAIVKSHQKHFFIIDDMIPSRRLLDIAKVLKPLHVKWTCQLKPTADFDHDTLKTLYESGLTMIIWGVESGSERILKLMKKGTIKEDIETVLHHSHAVGIRNVVYIMFGFPTETEGEFLETIDFLKKNENNIDLISTAIFGLQKGTFVYNHPEQFGIVNITEEERTVLNPKVKYELSQGLTQEEVRMLVKKHKHTIESINKFPRTMNYFREHMVCLV